MGFALLWKTKGYITNINEFLIQKSLQLPQNYNGYWSLFTSKCSFHSKKKLNQSSKTASLG